MEIRNKLPSDEPWIRELLLRHFGWETLVSRGVAHHAIDLPAVHRGAVRESRRLKPEIPEFAPDGTPIEAEIEFEFRL